MGRALRTYIFTALERQILKGWLNGEVALGDVRVRKILSRVRLFKELAFDIDLYLTVRRRLAESKAAATA